MDDHRIDRESGSMILADDVTNAAFCALVAMLVAAVVYAVSQFRKGFSLRKLLIAMAVCSLVLAVLNWIGNNVATRIPENKLREMRERRLQKN
jgi:hypothetical protein